MNLMDRNLLDEFKLDFTIGNPVVINDEKNSRSKTEIGFYNETAGGKSGDDNTSPDYNFN